MSPLHYFYYFLFSISINLFNVVIYVVYFSDLSFKQPLKSQYDFVIVGSGTAGSLIAYRIATETNYSVVVLEAGRRSHAILHIPVFGPLLHGSIYDWLYETVPQVNACLAMDKKCKLTQGKIVGGSSKLNNMIHWRGNISHYVDWFNGRHSMEYIKSQFEYIENNILQLNELQYQSQLAVATLNAAEELGYDNFNKENTNGFMKPKLTQKNGQRWCMSDNLNIDKYIISNALVERILINNNVAHGVEFISSNKNHKVYARKAVILSAGTYNTPKLLQLSGIGPEKLLKSLGIPVLRDLPVGENLQDHVSTGFDFIMFNNSLSVDPLNVFNPINIIQYFIYGKGLFTFPGCEVIGFVSTKNETSPSLQLMVLPVGISSDKGSNLRKYLGISDDFWYDYFAKTFDKHTATILPVILHPKSKGTVHIKSKNPKTPPLIDPKYLSHKDDIETLINGVKFIMKLVNTTSMGDIGAYINPIPFPGCEDHVLFSDLYLDCYIRHLTLTSYHPVGTCSMGLPESKTSVVDTSFKVIGVNKLYVVDGSVLPTLPSGNINAAIAMMANVFYDTVIAPKIFSTGHINIPTCNLINYLHEKIFSVCFPN